MMENMFKMAVKFTGTGLAFWNVAGMSSMANAFDSARSLTPCNKLLIATNWPLKTNNFATATYKWTKQNSCLVS